MKIKITMRYNFIPIRMARIKKPTNVDKDVESLKSTTDRNMDSMVLFFKNKTLGKMHYHKIVPTDGSLMFVEVT